jgi:hypothetical protein
VSFVAQWFVTPVYLIPSHLISSLQPRRQPTSYSSPWEPQILLISFHLHHLHIYKSLQTPRSRVLMQELTVTQLFMSKCLWRWCCTTGICYLDFIHHPYVFLTTTGGPPIEASSINQTQQSMFHLMTREEWSLDTLWLKTIRMTDKIQITDPQSQLIKKSPDFYGT